MAGQLFFYFRIAAIPVLVALIAVLETHYSFPTLRLCTFILVFFVFADIASLLRGRRRDFAVAITSLAFGLCVIEAAANIFEPKELTTTSPDGMFTQRPVLGWGPMLSGHYHSTRTEPKTGAVIYNADYTIDANLLRETRSCDTGPAIVFFGCSYTFGYGLNDADTLPQSFADSLGRKERVLNLGFNGYGPQQFLSALQSGIFDSVIGTKPKLFVYLTAPWHAERSACKSYWVRHGPRYVLENGQVHLTGPCREGFDLRLADWLANSAAYRWLIDPLRRMVSHDDVELYIAITLAAVNLAKAKYGVPTIILYCEARGGAYLRGTGFSTEAVIQRLRDGGAVVIDASLEKEEAAGMAITIPGDSHPTPAANRLRAAILKDYLRNNMSEVLASRIN